MVILSPEEMSWIVHEVSINIWDIGQEYNNGELRDCAIALVNAVDTMNEVIVEHEKNPSVDEDEEDAKFEFAIDSCKKVYAYLNNKLAENTYKDYHSADSLKLQVQSRQLMWVSEYWDSIEEE